MNDILPFLKSLVTAPGLSGYESPVARLIEARWRPLVDELSLSRLGSVHGLRKGNIPAPRPSIVITAHMDAIGLMVTRVVDGFLHITSIGDVDPRILPGQPVIVHGLKDLPAVVVQPPGKLLPESLAGRPTPLEHLLVDVGLEPGRVTQLVRVGDPVSFASEPVELAGGLLSAHSLDNRASVAALTVCLEELRSRTLAWDVWAVATVQEEIGLVGAATSSFQIKPDIAIAVDTTYGKGPGADDWNTFELGGGPTLSWGAETHPILNNEFKELAERSGIPFSIEIMPGHSCTDAYAMQMAAAGIPCFVLGIPIRYMHTPVEVVAPIDILRTGRLLSEFIARLDPGFLDGITWDDAHA